MPSVPPARAEKAAALRLLRKENGPRMPTAEVLDWSIEKLQGVLGEQDRQGSPRGDQAQDRGVPRRRNLSDGAVVV